MSPSTPFVDRATGRIDYAQVLEEAVPVAKLVGLFLAVALVPLAVVFALGGNSIVGVLFTLVAQFVLAVGSGVVLVYVVARGVQLSDD